MTEATLSQLTTIMDEFISNIVSQQSVVEMIRASFHSLGLPQDPVLEDVVVNHARQCGFAGVDIGRRYHRDGDKFLDDDLVLRVFLNGFDQEQDLRDFDHFTGIFIDGDIQGISPMENPEIANAVRENLLDAGFRPQKFQLMMLIKKALRELEKIAKASGINLDTKKDVQILGMDAHTQALSPGESVSRINKASGTITGLFFEKDTGDPVLMSCWHVLSGRGRDGKGSVIHPGRSENGRPGRDHVADIDLPAPKPDRRGDVAVAKILDWDEEPILYQYDIPNGPDSGSKTFPITESRKVTHQDISKRICVTSRDLDDKMGVIDGVGTYFVKFGRKVVGIDGFRIVPEVLGQGTELSMPGDSGTMRFLEENGEFVGVGVHFAGEPFNNQAYREYALASHLPDAMKKLGVSFTKD